MPEGCCDECERCTLFLKLHHGRYLCFECRRDAIEQELLTERERETDNDTD